MGQSARSPEPPEREPQTAAELADHQIAHYRQAIENGTGNPAVCRDMIDRCGVGPLARTYPHFLWSDQSTGSVD